MQSTLTDTNHSIAPTYLSARAADVVLSDIRPTKLEPDALRSINVLLDELLWMILSNARSFSTEQLKLSMSRMLPTPLGKEALLEAEVELKAYWDRTAAPPNRVYTENAPEFPIQPAFEVRLRLFYQGSSSQILTVTRILAGTRYGSATARATATVITPQVRSLLNIQ